MAGAASVGPHSNFSSNTLILAGRYSEKIEDVFQVAKKDSLALGTFFGLVSVTIKQPLACL